MQRTLRQVTMIDFARYPAAGHKKFRVLGHSHQEIEHYDERAQTNGGFLFKELHRRNVSSLLLSNRHPHINECGYFTSNQGNMVGTGLEETTLTKASH